MSTFLLTSSAVGSPARGPTWTGSSNHRTVTECLDTDLDGFTDCDGDCNDCDAAIFPGATEIAYDGIDQDCDGYDLEDVDGDGYPFGEDCNDDDPTINPAAEEIADDGIDQNCDGVDLTGPTDLDGDGFSLPEDCDDNDAAVFPGAPEICDGLDNDCDGAADVLADGSDVCEVDCSFEDLYYAIAALDIADETKFSLLNKVRAALAALAVDESGGSIVALGALEIQVRYLEGGAVIAEDDAAAILACATSLLEKLYAGWQYDPWVPPENSDGHGDGDGDGHNGEGD